MNNHSEDFREAGSRHSFDHSVVLQVLRGITSVADSSHDLAERRSAVLALFAEVLGSTCGIWAWGYGWPSPGLLIPIAVLDFGMTVEDRASIMQWGIDKDIESEFQVPIMQRVLRTNESTDVRRDIISDDVWSNSHMRRALLKSGWASWAHSVRYSERSTWSNIIFFRKLGQEEFGAREAAILSLMLQLPWMQSTAEESMPPTFFEGLTFRQRTVLLMLLDGKPRKTIAQHLGIAEDTVGDHIKAIYAHFQVNSAGELAAHFLRKR